MQSLSTSNTYNVSGHLYLGSTATPADQNTTVWAQGYNLDGSKNERWVNTGATASGTYQLTLQQGYSWKVSARAEGYQNINAFSYGTGTTGDQIANITLATMSGYTALPSTTTVLNPGNGGVLKDNANNIQVTVGVGSLDASKGASTLTTLTTTTIPDTASSQPIGGSAKEIRGTYSDGTPITNFNNDVDIELSYSSGELQTALGTGYTMSALQNLKISYFDPETNNWNTIPTYVDFTVTNPTYVGTGSINNYANIWDVSFLNIYYIDTVVLHGKVNHLTMFSSFVNSTVNSSTSVANTPQTTTTQSPSSGGGGG